MWKPKPPGDARCCCRSLQVAVCPARSSAGIQASPSSSLQLMQYLCTPMLGNILMFHPLRDPELSWDILLPGSPFPPALGSVQVWSATWGWDKLSGWWLCLRTPCYHLHLLPPGMPRVGTSAGFYCVISLCRSSECREVSVQIGSDGSHLHKVLPFSTESPVQWLKSRCPWLYWAAGHSPGPWALGTASPRL